MTRSIGKTNHVMRDTYGRPFRDLRISVTDRCNFRCTYCMPAEIFGERYEFLPKKDLLTFEEITRITSILLKLGGMKLRLTGGEPLVRNGVDRLVAKLANLDGVHDLTLTTNGYLLPKFAQKLKNAGLERITVSLDSLDEKTFKKMNGRGFSVKSVLSGLDAAERAGFSPVKINSVVIRGLNDHTIVDTARYFKERGHIVRFIEYMDVGNLNGWKMDEVVTAKEIVDLIHREMPIEPVTSTYRGEVANRYRYLDGSGELGVIASVTKPFCGECTRLRLSPEGELFTCLFGTSGTDIREHVRSAASDDDIETVIRKTWATRADRYSEKRTSKTELRRKVEMYHIGG